ncbi:sigma-70 family RNA polymerase sigma factor [Pseudonocardia alaniniphila]|uniref:Sigma-70 family RNA polymerase sigma factor n=1 Tax=Pseudonocardia alaniniphila TaxID=75291 RepID=A0ABS9TCM5_9PSEU|nr:sigma-70 family RNA polymerase sigma factor [Pseudonocardia alaniniphila]MCH6166262.1 sigma-70 family RNA polymerase sigma factor [Pseudonocardia alaniniphila]
MRLSDVDVIASSGPSEASTNVDAATSVLPVIAEVVTPDPVATDGPAVPEVAEAVADFESVRPRLFGIAYRMLGGVADAEDIVQEVWLRWQTADRAGVRDRVGFLVTITTRLALNAATSARARREVSVGRWLPDRASDAAEEPSSRAERIEALELAVRLLLERLSPVERAVYILREAFGYPFCEIATTLVIGESNARQLARRARMHLAEQRRMPVDPEERGRLLATFIIAAQAGDVARLKCLLIDDIDSYRDRIGHTHTCRSAMLSAGHSATGKQAGAARRHPQPNRHGRHDIARPHPAHGGRRHASPGGPSPLTEA